ncbi:MAG: hypothetical protein JWP74_3 [Marmoricola sp.]|nr:hypothetical protein [Marmoricola sp.]
MSSILFLAIAIGWAVYLLPKALKHHDDVAKTRPVREFSDSVRVLGRGVAAAPAASVDAAPVASVPAPPTITRETARRAAGRRRRVLALLLSTLVAVAATSYLGYTPRFTVAIPATLVVAFLVIARLTVRAQQVRRVAPVQPAAPVETPVAISVEDTEPDLGSEDTVGISRDELAAAVGDPVLDEGGLWDPLPVTLPTYVNKARARRTVRTIEITATSTGITSSGHDAGDTALANQAAAAEQEAAAAALEVEAETPKAAGA